MPSVLATQSAVSCCGNTQVPDISGLLAAPGGSSQRPLMTSPLTLPASITATRLFHPQLYQTGRRRGIAVFTFYRSILFNPRDDAFSHELKIALPPPQ